MTEGVVVDIRARWRIAGTMGWIQMPWSSMAEVPLRPAEPHGFDGDHLKNIFVGNLDFGATEDSIRTLFEQYGAVERVTLMKDRDTGRSRGFAFVEMTDTEEAERAISSLNGTNFGGRTLNVNEARPKVSHGGGPRPGGGGGRGGFRGGREGGPRGGRREPRW